MKVREIMSPAVTVPADAPVGQVVQLMLQQHLSGLAVVDDSGRVLGLVTERDVVTKHAHPHVPVYLGILGGVLPIETRHMDEEVRRVLAVTAADLMTEDPKAIAPDADVEDAADLMADLGVNPLAVKEDGELVGLVSNADIMRLVVREEEDGTGGAEG